MPTNKPGKVEEDQGGTAFVRALRETFVCGIALVNADGRSVSLNPDAASMLGLPVGTESLSIDKLPPVIAKAIEVLTSATGKTASQQVETNIPERGSVTLHLSTVPPPHKELKGCVLLLRDLTPLRQIERKVWRLDRLASIGTLSASMAHEIKNALVAGKTFMDLLLEKHPEGELVGVVRREMARIDSIVSRILGFAGPARTTFEKVNVHKSLEHSLRLVQPQLEGKTITLSRSFRASPEIVNGDDHELQQAFVNLFLNALEAMDSKGTLTVETESQPGGAGSNGSVPQIRVVVKDTGRGISPRDLARLFEPFFTTKLAGTGLGLPITQRIIDEHRGSIEVASDPGKGTTFCIMLPVLGDGD
jgi:two-component system sensor histidine kinase HydH